MIPTDPLRAHARTLLGAEAFEMAEAWLGGPDFEVQIRAGTLRLWRGWRQIEVEEDVRRAVLTLRIMVRHRASETIHHFDREVLWPSDSAARALDHLLKAWRDWLRAEIDAAEVVLGKADDPPLESDLHEIAARRARCVAALREEPDSAISINRALLDDNQRLLDEVREHRAWRRARGISTPVRETHRG